MKTKITIKERAEILSKNARQSMRDCALSYRKARARGSVTFMLRWLLLAAEFRRIAAGYLEAA